MLFDMETKKEMAFRLRRSGLTYSEIAKQTGLTKSTLSYHLTGIPFTPNSETVVRIGQARLRAYETKRKKKLASIELARHEAEQEIGLISERDVFMLGIGIYAGEGSKTHDLVRLVNSDPRILRLFIRWLRKLGASETNFALRIHAYPETDSKAAERYWLKELELPLSSLQKMCIDTRKGKSKAREGAQPYGTAHLTICSKGNKRLGVFLARKISAYLEKVLR